MYTFVGKRPTKYILYLYLDPLGIIVYLIVSLIVYPIVSLRVALVVLLYPRQLPRAGVVWPRPVALVAEGRPGSQGQEGFGPFQGGLGFRV